MSTQEDLAWLAFCYASDELSPEAASEFENRLAAEQAAREAVAEAVLLISATQTALREQPYSIGAGSVGAGSVGAGCVGAGSVGAGSVGATSPAPQETAHRRQWSFGWIAVAAAACIAMLVVADGWLARQNRDQPVVRVRNADATLALAWAESQFPLDVGDGELLAGSDEYDDGDDSGSITVPDWMLEAVSVRQASEPPAPAKES
jgi:anti-sigma factor RsiW